MASSTERDTRYRPPPPVIAPEETYASVTQEVDHIVLGPKVRKEWVFGFFVVFAIMQALLFATAVLLVRGVGIWGVNIPVAWAYAIINFVWWIGIGHAGTLISAVLLLMRQQWRMAISRFAEAMTLFAVACAGLFPVLHLGRPWLAYWLFPYPNTMAIWPQFRSPLVWDVFAISTYITVSFLFWFVGLLPDLATMRDRASHRWVQRLFGFLAMGWRGSARHWHRYEIAALVLAGLATPLVVSVHTIVSFDFAVSVLPGWHSTVFPPYFVAGAIYSGFAMVLSLVIPIRAAYKLHPIITDRHMHNMAKMMLATGLIVAYGYLMEGFIAWYSGSVYEVYMQANRMVGPYAPYYWTLIACNVALPQLLWSSRVRTNMVVLFIISVVVNLGMWLERFVIVITSLHRDFLPSSWGMYAPTFYDWATYVGTIGLFLTLIFVFIRVLPLVSMFEVRTLVRPTRADVPPGGRV